MRSTSEVSGKEREGNGIEWQGRGVKVREVIRKDGGGMEKDGWRKKVKAECGDVCRFAVGLLSLLF